MRRHLDLMIEVFGEDHGCRLFRKPAAWYAKRFGPAKEFKKGVTQFSTRAEFETLLENYRKWRAPYLDEQNLAAAVRSDGRKGLLQKLAVRMLLKVFRAIDRPRPGRSVTTMDCK